MWGQQGGNWNNPPPYQQPQGNWNQGGYPQQPNYGMNMNMGMGMGMGMGAQLDPNTTYKILSAFNPLYCID